jgi:hypothetical protein
VGWGELSCFVQCSLMCFDRVRPSSGPWVSVVVAKGQIWESDQDFNPVAQCD